MVDLQKFKPPHVATKVGDIPEIIEHRKNGLLDRTGRWQISRRRHPGIHFR
jgi:hypothetical protein